jgi:hypothetical protein
MSKTINVQQQEDFLNAYVSTRGNIQQSCKVAGIDRTTFYNWKKRPDFSERLVFFVEQSEDKIIDDITLALYNEFMWEAQIRSKIQAGDNKLKRGMKDADFHNLGFKLLALTKKGKVMLGMVQPTETAQTDVSGGTERLLGELRTILPNPNIPASRRNIEDLDHFGNPIKKEGENE